MKKMLSLGLWFLLSAILLTGCAISSDDWLEGTTEYDTCDKIEIEFWHSMGSSNGILIQELTEKFNQSQNEIYVKAVHQGSYTDANTKLQAAVSAGEPPVIAQMEIGNIGIFAESGQLLNLQTFVNEESFDMNDFMWGLLDASYYEGGLIALPHSRSLPVMYYNKDLFLEHGLPVDQPPENWNELKIAASILTGQGIYGYSCPIDPWYYNALMMCSNGSIFDTYVHTIGFENESGTSPLYLWKEMVENGTMYIPSGLDYNSSEACRNMFAEGNAAMIMQSSAQLKGLEKTCSFEVGVAPIPIQLIRAYPAGGSNLVLFEGHSEEKQRAGWEFIKFMVSTENSVEWANGTGYLPLRLSCMESELYKNMIEKDQNLQIIIDNVKYCSVIPFIPEYAETMEIISEEIQTCILEDGYSPEDAVASIADRVEKLLFIYREEDNE